jgi:hypothetical protein
VTASGSDQAACYDDFDSIRKFGLLTMTKHLACLFAATLTSIAQTAPVVLPRGIVNAFTQLPAPATVGRGGIIEIDGLNLGPPSALQASGPPLPTQ